MHALLIAINSKYVHTALGLRYVGEYAKAQGFDVHLIEETINTPILAVLENIMDSILVSSVCMPSSGIAGS